MKKFVKRIGFKYAWEGITYSFIHHLNFRLHVLVSLAVVCLMLALPISRVEQLFLIFAIMLGLVVELLNTAVESVVDLVTQEWRLSARIAKDVAAGAMLITAVGTAIIGLVIFLPPLAQLFRI